MSKWISVEDRLPPFDMQVLITNGIEIGHARLRNQIFNKIWQIVSSNHCEPTVNVTHWMPLPEPHKEQEQ